MRKPRILFFSEAVTLAHLVRPYKLACSLDRNEYEIGFACADRYRFVFDQASEMRRYFISSLESEEFIRRVDTCKALYGGDEVVRYVKEDLEIIDDFKPDLIVGDFRHSLSISSRLAGVKFCALLNAYWSSFCYRRDMPVPEHRDIDFMRIPMIDKMMPLISKAVYKIQAKALNTARRHFGLRAFEHCLDGWSFGDQVFYYDIPSLSPTVDLPSAHTYMGPVNWIPSVDSSGLAAKLDKLNKPVAYVSMGSSGNADVIPVVVDCLVDQDYHVVVCTSNRNLELAHKGKNVDVVPLVDGDKVCAVSDLVVCNGGSPMTYQAFSKGVPVIGVPSNMDQLICMRNAEDFGAALTVRFRDVLCGRLSERVDEIKSNDMYRNKAKELARELRSYDAESIFSERVSALV